jgi:hypothetical protein
MNVKMKWIIGLITLGLASFIFYGIVAYSEQRDGPKEIQTYGRVEGESSPVPISSLLSGDKTSNVTIEGKVVSMGPTMGCWLVINDGTGEILIQTEPMLYIHQEVQGETIRATGSLAILNGGMGFSGKTLSLLTPGIQVIEEKSR